MGEPSGKDRKKQQQSEIQTVFSKDFGQTNKENLTDLISKEKKISSSVGILAAAGKEKPLVTKMEETEGTRNPVEDTEQNAMTGFESLRRNKRT